MVFAISAASASAAVGFGFDLKKLLNMLMAAVSSYQLMYDGYVIDKMNVMSSALRWLVEVEFRYKRGVSLLYCLFDTLRNLGMAGLTSSVISLKARSY
jgi:hypothetical protein